MKSIRYCLLLVGILCMFIYPVLEVKASSLEDPDFSSEFSDLLSESMDLEPFSISNDGIVTLNDLSDGIYTYFVETGFNYTNPSSSVHLWNFRSYPNRSFEYGDFDVYAADGSYLGKKTIYIWFASAQDYANPIPYLFTDRPYTSTSTPPAGTTIDARIYNIQYDVNGLKNGKPILGVNYFPESTGLSYSTICSDYMNLLYCYSNGVTIPSGSSVGICKISFEFACNLSVGSYLFSFPVIEFENDSGYFPNVFLDPSNYSVFGSDLMNYSRFGQVTAFHMDKNISNISFCLDVTKQVSLFAFDIYFFVSDDVPSFFYQYNFDNSNHPIILQADTNIILDTLQQGNIDANNNADNIMHAFDNSSQQDDNQRFEDSRQELQDEEDSLFSSAMEGFSSLDMEDYSLGKFTAMASALSFVSGFMQSLYVQMGDFGSIVTIGLVLLIASLVIGLYKYQVIDHSG